MKHARTYEEIDGIPWPLVATFATAMMLALYLVFTLAGCVIASQPKGSYISSVALTVTDKDMTERVIEQVSYAEESQDETADYSDDYIYYEPVYTYTETNSSGYDNDFKRDGVRYGEDGTRYTWYSQNVLPGGGLTELNENGRHVNEQGYICDGDGYIAVASSDHPQGTVLDTPFGEAKVYDTGCASGTVDVYTDF